MTHRTQNRQMVLTHACGIFLRSSEIQSKYQRSKYRGVSIFGLNFAGSQIHSASSCPCLNRHVMFTRHTENRTEYTQINTIHLQTFSYDSSKNSFLLLQKVLNYGWGRRKLRFSISIFDSTRKLDTCIKDK